MTSRERIQCILAGEIPDRIGVTETFWQDTIPSWFGQGYPEGKEPWEVFGHDMIRAGGLSHIAFPERQRVIDESEEWVVVENGNGATMKQWKQRPGVPEHLGFEITNGKVWRREYRDAVREFRPDRVALDRFRKVQETARNNDVFYCFAGPEVFEIGKNYAGHEHMCIGMALEPDWIDDMFDSFVEMQIANWRYVFDNLGLPDAMWVAGDIGFKGRPFISPQMHRELVVPHNRRLIRFFKDHGLKVIFHSCGFIEPLVPGFIETGIDMLQAMEVKAGCDIRRLKPLYGDTIGFCGNIDIRELESNDLARVDTEIRAKVDSGMAGGGYIFHTDHSVPSSVRFETYRHAVERAKECGTYF